MPYACKKHSAYRLLTLSPADATLLSARSLGALRSVEAPTLGLHVHPISHLGLGSVAGRGMLVTRSQSGKPKLP